MEVGNLEQLDELMKLAEKAHYEFLKLE